MSIVFNCPIAYIVVYRSEFCQHFFSLKPKVTSDDVVCRNDIQFLPLFVTKYEVNFPEVLLISAIFHYVAQPVISDKSLVISNIGTQVAYNLQERCILGTVTKAQCHCAI